MTQKGDLLVGIVSSREEIDLFATKLADIFIETLIKNGYLTPRKPEGVETPTSPATSPDDFIKVDEVARLTNYVPTYVYRLAQNKVLPSYKPHGRGLLFKRGEVIEWLNKSKIMSKDEATAKAAETVTNLNIKNIRKGGKK